MIRPNLKNAAGAAVRLAKAVVAKKPVFVSDDLLSRRLAACEACPNLSGDQCRLCTCFVDVKAMLATETCPDSRWNFAVDKPREIPH